MDAGGALAALAADYWDGVLRRNPILATFFGDSRFDDRLPDIGPSGRADEESALRDVLRRLDGLSDMPLEQEDQITRDMLRLAVQAGLDSLRLRLDEMSVDQMDGPQVWLLELINWHPTDTVEHAEQLIQRYKAFDTFMDQYLEVLDEGVRDHRTAPRIAVDRVQAQLEALLQKPLDAWPMAQLATAQPELKSALDDVLDGTVAPAFRRMATYLQSYAARPEPGVWSVTNGDEIYALLARQHTTTDLTPDELHQIGLDDLHHIHAEMQAIMARRGANGASIREFTERLTRDPANLPNSREELIAISERLLAQAQAALPKAFGRLPRSPIVVKPVEEYRERDAPAAYYFQPSPDGSRPGVFYVNTFEPEARPRHTLPALAFHEGVPGHHLQIGQTAYRTEKLNRWQRLMCWVSGHGEGWALYAERLMDELGHLADPGDRLGMLDAQALRAARVIVDIGMHLQLEIPAGNPFGFHPGERWTPELGLEFMRQHCRMEDPVIVFEVNRYLGWPGQAPSYKVGERIWLQARADARARLGGSFDLKSFHRAALDLGSLGLDPLRAALARIS